MIMNYIIEKIKYIKYKLWKEFVFNNGKGKILNFIRRKFFLEEKIIDYLTLNSREDSLSYYNYRVQINEYDSGYKIPHFHFYDLNKTFHLEIKIENIENLTIIGSRKRKGIKRKDLLTWKGLEKEKELLNKWLFQIDTGMKRIIEYTEETNYHDIVISWNMANPKHEIKIEFKEFEE